MRNARYQRVTLVGKSQRGKLAVRRGSGGGNFAVVIHKLERHAAAIVERKQKTALGKRYSRDLAFGRTIEGDGIQIRAENAHERAVAACRVVIV